MSETLEAAFLTLFEAGDVEGAKQFLARHPSLAEHAGYQAHPLLQLFVDHNSGHCYKQSHLRISDMLIPARVHALRSAVFADENLAVQKLLDQHSTLVHAEFTRGRGIDQAIHHFRSVAMGQVLLDAGANIEVKTTRGDSPLDMRLRFGSVDTVRFLLERGADPNNGPCAHIPSDSLEDKIALLQEYGWEIGSGQIHHDANHGFGRRVQTWLRAGVDPNAKDEHGQTALHILAARGTGAEAIRALVEAGADINSLDANGRTPLAIARSASRSTAARELISLGAT